MLTRRPVVTDSKTRTSYKSPHRSFTDPPISESQPARGQTPPVEGRADSQCRSTYGTKKAHKGMAGKGIVLGSRIVDKNGHNPIGNQSWKVALRPETAGKTQNPVSGKYSSTCV